jgi:plasmid maintenance system antidote protein VapI
MAMKNPAHPGELIRDNIDELGLSVTEAAKGLGGHFGCDGTAPGNDVVKLLACHVRLEKAIGSTADTWLRMQMNYDLA